MLALISRSPLGCCFVLTAGRTAREKLAQTGPAPSDAKAPRAQRGRVAWSVYHANPPQLTVLNG